MRGLGNILAITILITIVLVASIFYYTNIMMLVSSGSTKLRISVDDAYLVKTDAGLVILRLRVTNIGTVQVTRLEVSIGDVPVLSGKWYVEWFRVERSDGTFGSKVSESYFTSFSYSYDWGSGNVYDGCSDKIGYRAHALVEFLSSTSTIKITTDDGMQVYIDGESVFEGSWRLQSPTTYTETISVKPGVHEVVVEWYEWGGYAVSCLSISDAHFANQITLNPGESIAVVSQLSSDFNVGESYTLLIDAYDSQGNKYSLQVTLICEKM